MTYPVDHATFADLLRLAEDVIARRSNNFVNDALLLARWILRDGKRAIDDRAELVHLIEEIYSGPSVEKIAAARSIAQGMIR
jgi:hypothetical protein